MMSSVSHYTSSLIISWILIVSIFQVVFLSVACAAENEVEKSFQEFNEQWMENKYKREASNKKNLTCKKVKDYYRAEYTGYSRTYSSIIKKTSSKETPYIGILSYKERKFASHAKTFEGALRGPFDFMYEYPVKEIFIFSNGEWRY
jgi:hypothetical protein